jgi:hypothetical protein
MAPMARPEFVVARNPDPDSTLPYLIRLPLGDQAVVLKVRDSWPRTAKVFCHAATSWPADPDIVERVPVRSCVRRGAAIDLVLDRGRENRSQIVFTRIRGGREAIFWQTARTAKQARPNLVAFLIAGGERTGSISSPGVHSRMSHRAARVVRLRRSGTLATKR